MLKKKATKINQNLRNKLYVVELLFSMVGVDLCWKLGTEKKKNQQMKKKKIPNQYVIPTEP